MFTDPDVLYTINSERLIRENSLIQPVISNISKAERGRLTGMDFLFRRYCIDRNIVMKNTRVSKGFIPKFSIEANGIKEAFSVRNCVTPVRKPRREETGPEINRIG
jgi:hypothetical protein